MRLIAKKPCSFGGKKFYIGEEIPREYVLDPKTQEKMGVLTIVNIEGEPDGDFQPIVIPDPTFSILVNTENGTMDLEPTDEGIQDIFNVLIGKAADAEAIINQMDDADALILLHLSDSRKSVKELAEARAKALMPADGDA